MNKRGYGGIRYTAVDWRKHHEVARKQKCWYKYLALWFTGSSPVAPFIYYNTQKNEGKN